jgi:hypothetical protein
MSGGIGRTHRVRGVLVLLALLTGGCALLRAQQETPPGWNDSSQPMPVREGVFTLHTGVQLVVQDITVIDANGHSVTGLKPEEFRIFEDGRPQTIKNFEEHAPIDPVLAEERQAELDHALPANTFTNYKAFKGDAGRLIQISEVARRSDPPSQRRDVGHPGSGFGGADVGYPPIL